MKLNLSKKLKIRRDEGIGSKVFLNNIEDKYNISINGLYNQFILEHNEARIINNCFNFYNNSRRMNDTDSLAFLRVEQIEEDINDLLEQNEADENPPYFEKGLIPFGENGGGDFICFDYRQNPKTDNPPIILWSHDVENNSQRISFIANNFEEFINMLYESNDED